MPRILDRVRAALASEPRLDLHEFPIALSGVVPSEAERDMAEFDTRYVFGVDDVDNRIDVHRR